MMSLHYRIVGPDCLEGAVLQLKKFIVLIAKFLPEVWVSVLDISVSEYHRCIIAFFLVAPCSKDP